MSRFSCINLLLAIFIHLTSAEQATPVFLIDDNNILPDVKFVSNPFARVHTDEFELIVRKALTKAAKIIVFVEEVMSTEDLTSKDTKGTPFQKLRSGLKTGKVKYHPAVISPYETLTTLIKQTQYNTYSLGRFSMTDNPDFLNRNMKSLYVVFNDDDTEKNIDRLRRHDTQIMDMFKYIRRTTLGNVVAFFTAKSNHRSIPMATQPKKLKDLMTKSKEETKVRDEIQKIIQEANPSPTIMITSNGAKFRLRLSKLSKSRPTKYTRYHRTTLEPSEALSNTDLNSLVSFGDFDLLFSFSLTPKMWRLGSVSLIDKEQEVGRTNLNIRSSWNTSYLCFDPITLRHYRDGSVVTISDYQIEPRYSMYEIATKYGGTESQPIQNLLARAATTKVNSSTDNKFSKPEHCGPFFTATILSATIVVATMVLITSGGILAILDCKSNNKFDDVNVTKRLTIIEN